MPSRASHHWPASVTTVLAAVLSVVPVGIAQTTQAVCQSSYSWMDNSKGQSPCVIVAYLGGVCYNGQFNVPALQPNYIYYGPDADQPKQLACECNSVFYTVSSACGICQGNDIISWSRWNFNCTAVGVVEGSFPPGIPVGTAIPQWAFQDVSASNMFNVTLAQSVGDAPESTGTHVQSTTSVSSTTAASASLTLSPSVTSTASTQTPSPTQSSSTGAIVGGVVGGVAGIALVAGVVAAIISIMKKKQAQDPNASLRYSAAPSSPAPASSYTGTAFTAAPMTQRLYDPSDPSTFPSSSPALSNPTYSNTSIRPGAYTGVPEVQR